MKHWITLVGSTFQKLYAQRLRPIRGLAIPILVAAIAACAVDQVQSVESAADLKVKRDAKLQIVRDKAAKAGSFHNRLLTFVRTDVNGHVKREKPTLAEEMAYAEASCNRFMKSEGVSYVCQFPSFRPNNTTQLKFSVGVPLGPRFDLSQTATGYLDQLQAAGSNSYTAAEYSAAAATITAAASNELTGSDLEAVLTVAAVGDSSAAYWETNSGPYVNAYVLEHGLDEPYTMMVDPLSQLRVSAGLMAPGALTVRYGWFRWKSVLNADIAGAVAGAIFGGQVAAGAGAASAYEAVFQILEHYT